MASRSLGTLTLDLIAKIGGFEQGMDKASRTSAKRMKEIQKQAEEVGKKVGIAFGTIAAGAAAAGAAALTMLRSTASATADTDRWAKSLNMSTSTLQEWQYAAQRAGLTGDNMADIFKDIGDKIGDALLTGGGEAVDAIDKLGLSLDDLAKMSPDKQLLAIAAGLDKVKSQSEKINILESLGNDLSRMLPLLDNGAAGFQRLASQSREFGIALSDEQNEALVKANELIQDLEFQVDGLRNAFVAGLADIDLSPLQGALNEMRDVVKDPAFQQGMADLATMVVKLTSAAAIGLSQLPNDLRAIKAEIDSIAAIFSLSPRTKHFAEVAKEEATNRALASYNKSEGGWNKFLTNPTLFVGDMFGQDLVSAKTASDQRLAGLNAKTQEKAWVDDGLAAANEKNLKGAKDLIQAEAGLTAGRNGANGVITKLLDSYDKLDKLQSDRAKLVASMAKDPENADRYKRSIAEIDKQIAGLNGSAKAATAAEAAAKKLQNQYDQAEESYERQIELFNTEIDKRKDATEVAKLQFELESGKLQGLSEQRKELLSQLAEELDRLKKLKQANEDDKAVRGFQFSTDRQLDIDQRALDTPLMNAYDTEQTKQRALEMLGIEQYYQDQLEDLRKRREDEDISQSVYDRETEILESALAKRLDMQRKHYEDVDALQQNGTAGFVSGFATQAEAAMDLYGNMQSVGAQTFSSLTDALTQWAETGKLDAKGFAASFIQSVGHALLSYAAAQVAMAGLSAFSSMIGIPFVGPAVAPGAAIAATAAAGVMMTAVGAALDGQAHDGIDSVPADGTWLLKKGERVTTAATSAKLDRTLEDVRSSGGGGLGGAPITIAPQVTVHGNPDQSTLELIKQATADGARLAYQRVADDLAAGRGTVAKGLQAGYSVGRRKT